MINKQLCLSVVTGLLMIGGLVSPTTASAVNPQPLYENFQPVDERLQPLDESLQQNRYWNIIAQQLARQIIANGQFGTNTLYVDEKPAALEVSRYLEQQLSDSLRRSGVWVSAPARARYAIELDVELRERLDGDGTEYVEGSDIDQLWAIREVETVYPGQYINYELVPLTMQQPVNINLLAGTDTEIIITARIMERGWIRKSHTYAFYFSAEVPSPEKEMEQEKALESDEPVAFHYDQGVFLDYQQKLDAEVEQLLNSYGF